MQRARAERGLVSGRDFDRRESMVRMTGDSVVENLAVKKLLQVLTARFSELDVRSVVMLMHSLARMRLPAKELYVKIGKAMEANYRVLEPKDTAILIWAYTRVQYFGVGKQVSDLITSKFDSPLIQYYSGDNSLWLA
jgi:hypothetical protein